MPNAQFHLHHYPQQEILADALLKRIEQEGRGDPFYQSHVLVRNQGMATWLKRRMAEQSGIAMQVQFPQPNRFLQDVIGNQSIDPEYLKWEIFSTLPRLLERKSFHLLASYLNSAQDPTEAALKRYQLSGIIAGLFDKYLLYRPEWVIAWEKNDRPHYLPATQHEPWQRELWLALGQTQGHGANHHWSQILLNDKAPIELPDDSIKALHVFGVSNFAPIYVQFLYRLSEQIPVHIYWMNPVEAHQGYWEDSPSRHQWTMAKTFDDPETLNHHNPLLASFGRLGREFVHTLYGGNHTDYHVQEIESHFPSPVIEHPQTRLQYLQSSLYNNKPSKEKQISDNDTSVSIHGCHTPLRELETLKNYLLTLAESAPLDTSDVLVMCPDIKSYAPAIEAVFGGNEFPALTFSIGDSHSPDSDPSIAAVLQLFSLHTLRFTNHEALALLSTPAIRNHFELSEDDLSTLRDWIIRNGIRWGFDRSHVQDIAPNCPQSPWTWRDGVNRMLLGYAMPNSDNGTDPETSAPTLWRGILPFHDIEGSNTRILGSLCQFLDWCAQIRNELSESRSLEAWVTTTRSWIDLGFDKDAESQQNLQPLYHVLDTILKQSTATSEELPVEVFREHLSSQLQDTSNPRGFLSGAITFCEMKPMRAIPSRVICLLGMNHDAFPRQNSEVQFDLTQLDRQKGDRSTRDDDTYSFLEALLSARESLYISYIGTSIKDGKERPPSTALQTLLDYEPDLKNCLHQEKLHSFDPHYFKAGHEISHNKALKKAAELLIAQIGNETETEKSTPDTAPFHISEPAEQQSLDLNRWISAITHPARHFLKNSLQARTLFKESPLDGNEAISLDTLDRYQMRQQILSTRGLPPEQIQAWKQQGKLPAGGLGKKEIDTNFSEIIDSLPEIPEVETMEITVEIDGITITGNIPLGEIDEQRAIVVADASSGKAATQLKTWIYQLLASAQLNESVGSRLFYIEKNQLKHKNLSPAADYAAHLSELMQVYHQSQQRPLPHFSQTALAYLSQKAKKGATEIEHEQSRNTAALSKWNSSNFHTGESEDEAIQYLFNTEDLFTHPEFTDEFISTAKLIWNPILANQSK